MRRRARFDASLGRDRRAPRGRGARPRDGARRGERRGRSAAADLHLLPSGADAGRADRADAARGLRAHHRRDRARVPHRRRRPSRSASSAPRRRSATPAFRIRCRRCAELPDRLDSVLHVVYLVFNEGYFASSGESLTRHDLSAEAIRLGRLLVELLPEPEAIGLLALMLLHESRRAARTVAGRRADSARRSGSIAVEPRSDRRRGGAGRARADDAAARARTRCRRRSPPCTPRRASAAATDWAQIVGLYDILMRADPAPVVELNRAAAVAMRDGPQAGLTLVDAILARGDLADYLHAHSARADLCRRLGQGGRGARRLSARAGAHSAGDRSADSSRGGCGRSMPPAALRRRPTRGPPPWPHE